VSSNYLADLGTYRIDATDYTKGTRPLFNFSSDKNSYPLLDTVDMDFYNSYGFAKCEAANPDIITDTLYIKLRGVISDSSNWTTYQKKKFLFQPAYENLRNKLIRTRYDIKLDTFNIDQKKTSSLMIKLKANLDTILINNNVTASADLYAYIHNLADQEVKMVGIYIIAGFDNDYIGKINYYISNTPQIQVRNDQFAFWLKDYINSTTAAANTELVAMRLSGTFNKTKINADSLATNLYSKFGLSKAIAQKIAISINVTFSYTLTETISSSFNDVLILRYYSSYDIDHLLFQPMKQQALINRFSTASLQCPILSTLNLMIFKKSIHARIYL